MEDGQINDKWTPDSHVMFLGVSFRAALRSVTSQRPSSMETFWAERNPQMSKLQHTVVPTKHLLFGPIKRGGLSPSPVSWTFRPKSRKPRPIRQQKSKQRQK